MNIEELELSLRTDFEGQISKVIAEVRQNVADFQKKFEAEFEKHKAELDRSINALSENLPEGIGHDPAFKEAVTEHLRLARDDGAQVAAIAFGEAEKLKADTAPVSAARYDLVRNATNEICSKTTQSTILQSLVEGAKHFAPRGAFFIVKNDHLVGWKAFGEGVTVEEGKVREIHFPISDPTVLSEAARSMTAVSSTDNFANSGFLSSLEFGEPAEMHAIPLVARGRGVAVLYADSGNNGELNVEALETLVRVAGLTVELLAASQAAPAPEPAPVAAPEPAPSVVPFPTVETVEDAETEVSYIEQPTPVAEPEPAYEYVAETVEDPYSYQEPTPAVDHQWAAPVATEPIAEYEYAGEVTYETAETAPAMEYGIVDPEVPSVQFEPVESSVEETVPVIEAPAAADYSFASNDSYDASAAVEETYEEEVVEAPAPVTEVVHEFVPTAAEEPVVAVNGNGNGAVSHVSEPVVEVAAPAPVRTKLSDRNVDLPIEVADDERRLHNDARRFARLLVSEIKLYNEQKVVEGREASDLYDRLREAIDRSREMYDKRVQPAVASKFDYFHYELVNSLAEGEDAKLGGNYPGASV